jgi:hypothetical protein
MNPLVLMSDPRVAAIPVRECGEPLVDVRDIGPLGVRPTAGSCWAERSKPDRLPATYRRTHGVTYFHRCHSVGDDRRWGVNCRRKGTANSLAALKSIRAARSDGAPIYRASAGEESRDEQRLDHLNPRRQRPSVAGGGALRPEGRSQ